MEHRPGAQRPDASATSAPTPTISPPSSPACNVRSWPPISRSLLVPGIADGVAGMRFIEGDLESSRRKAAWVRLA
jgi:hypothetical protein